MTVLCLLIIIILICYIIIYYIIIKLLIVQNHPSQNEKWISNPLAVFTQAKFLAKMSAILLCDYDILTVLANLGDVTQMT